MKSNLRSRLCCVQLEDRVTPTVAGGRSPEQVPTTQFLAQLGLPPQYSGIQQEATKSDGLFLLARNFGDGIAVGRVHRDGSIDPSFGINGIVNVTTGIASDYTHLTSINFTQDDRIVVAGVLAPSSQPSQQQFFTTILLEDGVFDNSFDQDGKAIFSANGAVSAFVPYASMIDQAGHIVISGQDPNSHTFVTRLNSDGTIDTGFGNSGWTAPLSMIDGILGEQPVTGRIILVGSAYKDVAQSSIFTNDLNFLVTALTSDGLIDTTFGKNGEMTVAFDQQGSATKEDIPRDVFFRLDGAVTIVGSANRIVTYTPRSNTPNPTDDIAITRLMPNGLLDHSFGNDGKVLIQLLDDQYGGYKLTSLSGSANSLLISMSGIDEALITRVQSFGQVDLSYGSGGSKFIDPKTIQRSELESPKLSAAAAPSDFQISGSNSGSGTVLTPNGDSLSTTGIATYFNSTATVRTVTADVNGDGVPDLIGGSGPGGGPHVIVIDGKSKFRMAEFFAFEQTFFGGINVTAGDLNGDGKAEIVVTPDRGGGPIVAVYDGAKLADGFNNDAQITRFFGIEDKNFRGGARAAVGDVSGDGTADLLVSAGFEGGPRIALFDGTGIAPGTTPPKLRPDFYAFEGTLRNGAYVALGDLNGDGQAELVFGGGPGGGPRVRVFDGKGLLAAKPFISLDQIPSAQLANFFAADANRRGGIRLAIKEVDGSPALLAGSGENEAAQLRVFPATTLLGSANPQPSQVLDLFNGAVLADGVFVG